MRYTEILCSMLLFWSPVSLQWSQFQDDKCDWYDENWTCEDENNLEWSGLHKIYEDLNKNCNEDLAGTTLEMIRAGEEYIKYSPDGTAVMVIGITGTGRSSFSYFIAGNDSYLVAYRYGFNTGYLIKNCNERIVAGIEAGTIFPDLLHDSVTGYNFYDSPGFGERRSPCNEMAVAYFMTNTTSMLEQVQFMITIDYNDIRNLDRSRISITLKSVMNFIPNIDKFKNSFTLVCTKLRDDRYTDDQHVYDIILQLGRLKEGLPDLGFTEQELLKANILLDTIIAREQIVVFREPNDCGPLSEIPLMQYNKRNITNTLGRLQFTSCTPSDFNWALSSDAKYEIRTVANKAYPEIRNNLEGLISQISSSWGSNYTSVIDIVERLQRIDHFILLAKTITAETSGAFNSAGTFRQYFDGVKLVLIRNVPSFEKQVMALYESSKSVVNFLEYLLETDDSGLDWKEYGWDVFSKLQVPLEMESHFIRVMMGLFEQLSTADKHVNDSDGFRDWYKINGILWSPISMETFDMFWNKFEPILSNFTIRYQLREAIAVNPTLKFSILNSILAATLATPPQFQ